MDVLVGRAVGSADYFMERRKAIKSASSLGDKSCPYPCGISDVGAASSSAILGVRMVRRLLSGVTKVTDSSV